MEIVHVFQEKQTYSENTHFRPYTLFRHNVPTGYNFIFRMYLFGTLWQNKV